MSQDSNLDLPDLESGALPVQATHPFAEGGGIEPPRPGGRPRVSNPLLYLSAILPWSLGPDLNGCLRGCSPALEPTQLPRPEGLHGLEPWSSGSNPDVLPTELQPSGVTDGTRTRNPRSHNPGLYPNFELRPQRRERDSNPHHGTTPWAAIFETAAIAISAIPPVCCSIFKDLRAANSVAAYSFTTIRAEPPGFEPGPRETVHTPFRGGALPLRLRLQALRA